MISDIRDQKYAAAVQAIGHLRSVLGNLLSGEAVDVKGAYDATSWANIERVFYIKACDLAVFPDEILGRDAIERWHDEYPWSGQKRVLAKDEKA